MSHVIGAFPLASLAGCSAAQRGHKQARSTAFAGMRSRVSRGMLREAHQQGSLEPLSTAHELLAPHSGQREGSSSDSTGTQPP
jgi:hypothetical protein